MSNIKDELYRLMQSQRIEKSSDARYRTAPCGVTKARCKNLIKMIRAKQSCADVQVQQTGQQAIDHIRNVWIPQTKTEN